VVKINPFNPRNPRLKIGQFFGFDARPEEATDGGFEAYASGVVGKQQGRQSLLKEASDAKHTKVVSDNRAKAKSVSFSAICAPAISGQKTPYH